MADLQCGKFVQAGIDVNTKLPRWTAQLTPGPSRVWQSAFSEEHNIARAAGVYTGEGITILHTGPFSFSSPVGKEKAAADAVRELVAKTNARVARLTQEAEARAETDRRAVDAAAEDLQGLREKYPDGL